MDQTLATDIAMVEWCWQLNFTTGRWPNLVGKKKKKHLSMCFRSYVFTANGNTFLTSSRIAFLIVYPHEVKV